MTARKPWWIGLCAAVVIIGPAGCGSLFKSKLGTDQQPVSDARKDNEREVRDADPPNIKSDTYLAAGRLHESQGRLVKAAEQYRLAVAAKPDSVEALNRLGITLDRLGRFKEADDAFTKAIQLAPDKAHLHNNLAFSYILQQRWREAEVSLTKAIELSPGMTRARVNLAVAAAQQGRFTDAFTHFQAVLPIEDAHYNMGLMYQSKRLNVEAAKSFKAALRANPKLVAAQQRLDALPKEVISQADQNSEISASPPPPNTVQQLAAHGVDLTPKPATRPAAVETRPAIEESRPAIEESRPAVEPMPEEQSSADPLILDVTGVTAEDIPEADEVEPDDSLPRDD